VKKTGDMGEQLAVDFLAARDYKIIERQWRGVKGLRAPEIDIIAEIGDILVFIEVKTASTGKFGSPREWITTAKRKRLIDGAKAYLSLYDPGDRNCRFDAIIIDNREKPPLIRHIENAFDLSDINQD
jgi:putative endonuclease